MNVKKQMNEKKTANKNKGTERKMNEHTDERTKKKD